MVKHIHTEMESQINNSYWMDDESKKLAIEKLNTMKIFVGFPDWYRNKTAVINSYKGVCSIKNSHRGHRESNNKNKIKYCICFLSAEHWHKLY